MKGGRPGNLVEYRYDNNGQLTGVVNRAGVAVRQFAYENGLMAEHRNATGFTCTYRWEEIEGFPGWWSTRPAMARITGSAMILLAGRRWLPAGRGINGSGGLMNRRM